ncbi:ribosomal RNA processing protein 1 homolog A-like [Mixophyes fleayi]|uniref:ribosomal RNA processing protein 1 homolog A-like n=1 Tax=Mixophyes fleayi TaxID=3061075 RepID=UPI003F4E4027
MADPSLQLAQRLAANDKKSRDRALRKLRGYLRARSAAPTGGFTAEEFCWIWKGLFYCMWMQDKPLLQEQLALSMSQLIHALHTSQSQNLFTRCFWQTLNREWNGIDRLRLDKFYTLSRFVLRQSVELLKKDDWEESKVEEFLSILVEEVLTGEASRGVQHHLLDIYLDELAKVGSAELSAEMNLKLIEPFNKIAAKCKDPVLHQSVVNGIFQTILDQAPFAIEDLMKELGHTPTEDDPSNDGGHLAEDNEDIGPVLQFDYQALSDRLFVLASRKNVSVRNRKVLYWLVKRFKDLAEGVFPPDDLPEEVSTDEDDDEFSSWRFHKRQKKMAMKSQGGVTEPDKKVKRKRTAQGPDVPQELPGNTDVPPAKKKCKKKRSVIEQEAHSKLNGVTLAQDTEEQTEAATHSISHKSHTAEPGLDTSHTLPLKMRVRRKRRGCLIRLGLSVLPLRGALMRRRRIIRDRRKMISNKGETTVTPPAAKETSVVQDFATFQKTETPKPVYVKTLKGRGRQVSTKINCKSKKVTFSLNKNMTTEFKRTDRSLLVSPAGSSRIPFNPNQRPQHSVLKTPTSSPVPRARAADFF